MNYKSSLYNFDVQINEKTFALYNALTGAVIEYDKEERKSIKEILSSEACGDESIVTNLLNCGFLIEEDNDEFTHLMNLHQKFIDSYNINITMIPAESCNFDCPYCFIYSQRNIMMSDEVYEKIFKYIKNEVVKNPGRNVHISWYGGEPTLSTETIIEFMTQLQKLKEEHEYSLTSSMTTNGYLLDVETFIRLYNSGVKNYQITIDGDRDTHNSLRITKSKELTFDKIISNLIDISKLENITYDYNMFITQTSHLNKCL